MRGFDLLATIVLCTIAPITSAADIEVRQILLGEVPKGSLVWAISPDLIHWAYARTTPEGESQLVVDGVPRGRFDSIAPEMFKWSPDSRRLAFVTHEKDGMVYHVGDYISPAVALGHAHEVTFSDDGSRFAFMTGKAGLVFIDGKQLGPYDGLGMDGVTFSPDNKQALWVHYDDKSEYVLMDGARELTRRRYLGRVTISPDSKRRAFVSRTSPDAKPCLSLDGAERQHDAETIDLLTFSPDSRRLAYRYVSGRSDFIAVTEGMRSKIDDAQTLSLWFSPDSRRLAARVAARNREWQLVLLDGETGKKYQEVSDPVFSPDSRSCAWLGQNRSGADTDAGDKPDGGQEAILIVNGQEESHWRQASGPVYLTDGRLIFSAINANDRSMLVIGGQPAPAPYMTEMRAVGPDQLCGLRREPRDGGFTLSRVEVKLRGN